MEETKITLSEKEMPTHWYNIQADLPTPLGPPLHPVTHEPVGPEDLAPIFPMGLIQQEVSTERWIEIPDEVREIYCLYRPTPLFRAHRLEKALDTPAKIYYKCEAWSPPGSHKPNTAIAQAYYNKQEGVKRLTTETGAGQWGSALSLGCCLFGLKCTVYMVRISYLQKPYRRSLIKVWGSEVFPSPSDRTEAGKKFLAEDPDHPGSLGIAISEAVEDAVKHDDARYSLGSVLNHVLLHQTIVGLEAKQQMEKAGDYPDIVISCCGGGSNMGGISFPFAGDKLTEGKEVRLICTEPTACPTLTKGEFRYDFGDTAETAPMLQMYTLGHTFVPAPIHAGGLRYHGDAPLISILCKEGLMEGIAYHQNAVFEAGMQFARTEGIVPAPETNHNIRCAIDEALKCKESGEKKTILFNFSGHGHFDLAAYDDYLAGKLEDYELAPEKVKEALSHVPKL